MHEAAGYAVFLFPPALEALGDAIKPYLQSGPGEPHVLCTEIDTAGALIEMTLEGRTPEGKPVSLELMVPTGMVRMIVSAHSDAVFGFTPRMTAPPEALPPLGPTAAPAQAPSEALPHDATASAVRQQDKD